MRYLWWLIPVVAAVGIAWWAQLTGLAIFVTVVCGLAALAYLVTRIRRMRPLQPEQEREKHERFLRDIPPPPG
jgi:hypothetical protein